jgi:hypothetical protein
LLPATAAVSTDDDKEEDTCITAAEANTFVSKLDFSQQTRKINGQFGEE